MCSLLSTQEILEPLTNCFAELVAQPLAPLTDKHYVTYTAPTNDLIAHSITTFEARFVLAAGGDTGSRTWEAALRLGAFLCSDHGRIYVAGMNVIELGAGTGFLSILCANYLGANSVLATDGSTKVVDEINYNKSLNQYDKDRAPAMETAYLEWGHAIDGAKRMSTNFLYPSIE